MGTAECREVVEGIRQRCKKSALEKDEFGVRGEGRLIEVAVGVELF